MILTLQLRVGTSLLELEKDCYCEKPGSSREARISPRIVD